MLAVSSLDRTCHFLLMSERSTNASAHPEHPRQSLQLVVQSLCPLCAVGPIQDTSSQAVIAASRKQAAFQQTSLQLRSQLKFAVIFHARLKNNAHPVSIELMTCGSYILSLGLFQCCSNILHDMFFV